MPTYDYVCDACGHAFEHRQSMSSNRLRTCPECKQRKLRRLIGSGAGVIFKGSGFYETDYKRKSGGKPEASKSSEEGPSSEKPTESKPDTKCESSTVKSEKASSADKADTSKKKKKDS